MKVRTAVTVACLGLALSACSTELDLSCDKPMRYQSVQPRDRVVAPDDFDQLDRSREMPVPSASPRERRPDGAPCLDLPPRFTEDVKVTDEAPE